MKPATRLAVGLGFAMLFLGILVGTLVAMSAQSLAQAFLAALFALFGGSVIVLLDKVSEPNQGKAAAGILGLSLGAIIGLYSGLYVNEHLLLSPADQRNLFAKDGKGVAGERKYLRESLISDTNAIDLKYRNRQLSAEEAYGELRNLVQK